MHMDIQAHEQYIKCTYPEHKTHTQTHPTNYVYPL